MLDSLIKPMAFERQRESSHEYRSVAYWYSAP